MKKSAFILLLLIMCGSTIGYASFYRGFSGVYENDVIILKVTQADVYNMTENGPRHWANTTFILQCDADYVIAESGTYLLVKEEKYSFQSANNKKDAFFQYSQEISITGHANMFQLHYTVCQAEEQTECEEASVSLYASPKLDEGDGAWGEGTLSLEEQP